MICASIDKNINTAKSHLVFKATLHIMTVSDNNQDSENTTSDNMATNLNKQLQDACKNGHLPSAQEAVSAGADVNFMDSVGYTPVIRAIVSRHQPLADWLLSLSNVDVNTGKTAKYGNTTLHMACQYSGSDLVRQVAMRTDNVNARDDYYSYTPVQRAVFKGNLGGVVGLMPVLGVDWQERNKKGLSLLDMARYVGLKFCYSISPTT